MPDSPELTDEDIREALKEIGSYVDVTEEDLKKIYVLALKHARRRLASSLPVSSAMTTRVVAVTVDDDVATAVRLLSENRISGLPVIDNSNIVVGVISEADILGSLGMGKDLTFRDIIRQMMGESAAPHSKGDKVGDIMSAPAITVSASTDIETAARLLSEKRIKRLPVVDDDGRLVGIVARADIVRAVQSR
ncbi:MAG TPA: CBS domain-containing protein [Dissulfurispiraceae bacterium]|nr:CBS domain-containing protein [Dissulfurispiraceae bacterium]